MHGRRSEWGCRVGCEKEVMSYVCVKRYEGECVGELWKKSIRWKGKVSMNVCGCSGSDMREGDKSERVATRMYEGEYRCVERRNTD